MKKNRNNVCWQKHKNQIIFNLILTFCLCFTPALTVMGGGPTGTPSHANDKPSSLATCAAGEVRTFSVGYSTNAARNWNVSVISGSSWVTLTNPNQKTGNDFVNYQITPNYSANPRSAIILIDETLFTIEQKGADANEPCPLQVTPSNIVSNAAGGYKALNVNDGGQMLKWRITDPMSNYWLSFDPNLQIGSAQTWIWISPNNSDTVRVATLNVGGVIVPVLQTADSN